MSQNGTGQNNHLIFKRLLKIRHKGRKRLSAFYHICNQNKEKIILQERFALYAPDWELSFNVRIATQTILSEVVKVVQVNNATDVRIELDVLMCHLSHRGQVAHLPSGFFCFCFFRYKWQNICKHKITICQIKSLYL